MEERERRLRLWPGWKLEGLEDDLHEVGMRKVPVESTISSCGWSSSDSFKDEKSSLKEYSSAR